jgi:hypothetical protein
VPGCALHTIQPYSGMPCSTNAFYRVRHANATLLRSTLVTHSKGSMEEVCGCDKLISWPGRQERACCYPPLRCLDLLPRPWARRRLQRRSCLQLPRPSRFQAWVQRCSWRAGVWPVRVRCHCIVIDRAWNLRLRSCRG